MRIWLWILVGLTCFMLASCPATKEPDNGGQNNTTEEDDGGGNWDE